MINVLGWRFFAILVVLVTIGCGAAKFPFNNPNSVFEFVGLFSMTSVVLSALFYGVGQSPAFAWLCKKPPLNLFVPDIDGAWKGEISSNWPAIAAAHDITDDDGKPFEDRLTPVTADICVKLFSVSIELNSESGYQSSKTLSCALCRNSHRGFQLSYVFRSSVQDRKLSDEQSFLGAGLIDFSAKNPDRLEGVYWTNRKWAEGQNTAGAIVLKKIGDKR